MHHAERTHRVWQPKRSARAVTCAERTPAVIESADPVVADGDVSQRHLTRDRKGQLTIAPGGAQSAPAARRPLTGGGAGDLSGRSDVDGADTGCVTLDRVIPFNAYG